LFDYILWKKERKTHYHSLYKNVKRREQLQLILARFFFFFCTSWQRTNWSQNIDQTQHKRIFSFLLLACSQLEHIHTHYTDHMYTRETIIIHVMWAAHSWTVESIYKHLYTVLVIWSVPQMMTTKSFISKIWFLFFFLARLIFLYDVDLSLMNWTSEYVLALYSITLVAEGSLLFLSHLLYRTHHVCLLMILSLSLFLVFFCLSEENRDVFVCIEPSTTCHRHHHTGRLLTDS
jgi:hypothetical protein